MASYSKDDFVVGSDLSDISDISDRELNDFSPTSDDSCSEDDGRQYCVCGEPSTTEMIACDEELCSVVWWHYECAGLTSKTIPEDSWICEQCTPGKVLHMFNS